MASMSYPAALAEITLLLTKLLAAPPANAATEAEASTILDWQKVGLVRSDGANRTVYVYFPYKPRDLPEWLGHGGRPVDLSQHGVLIFAEIVDAPQLNPTGILERAERYRRDGQ